MGKAMTKTVRRTEITESQHLVQADRSVLKTHHFRAEVPKHWLGAYVCLR